jgi:tRNA nucleotidyltransferase (CCA-adding enzyme)
LVDAVLAAGDELGAGVFLVGGPVRDLLLGRAMRDVDLLVEPPEGRTSAGAPRLARAVAGRGDRVVSHDRFGTVKLQTAGGSLDLATTRAEHYSAPGALPTVAPGSLLQDLQRRDFTLNALAIPLNGVARRGRAGIVDPGEGLADLEARLLRVFHPRSFHDDPTRALRAARLAPRLGVRLARGSRAALRSALRDGAFGAVSGERYRAELEKLFADPLLGLDPAAALATLQEWHVLAALEPGLALPPAGRAPLRRLGRDLRVLPPALEDVRPWLAGLLVWLAPLDASLRRRTLTRLAVRGDAARRIGAYPRWRQATLRRLARVRGRGAADQLLRRVQPEELLALAASAERPLRGRVMRHLAEDRQVKLPVDGDDLLELGLRGAAVGNALDGIRVAVLDRRVRDRSEALALAQELGRRKSAAPGGKRSPPDGNRSPSRGASPDGKRPRS